MKTFDDFPEITKAGMEPIETDGKPEIGSTLSGYGKITRVKAIPGMCPELIDCLTRRTDTLAPNVKWIRHSRRPFVVWLIETDSLKHRHTWKYVPHPLDPELSNPLTRECTGCGRLEYLCGDFATWKEWPKEGSQS